MQNAERRTPRAERVTSTIGFEALASGGFQNDEVFAEVAAEARTRLQRVAAALR
jgi:hypothetical protein